MDAAGRPRMAPKAGAFAHLGGGGEPCTLCKKSVFPAEKLKTATDNIYRECCSKSV